MHKDISWDENQWNEVNVLESKIGSLGFHHGQMKILFETFGRKPEIMIIKETWLTDNNPLDRFEMDEYQPVESKPQEFFWRIWR